jgi:NAD(P)-dependent dehydrogenase (short-subunit alcohol dehydrogenase family)
MSTMTQPLAGKVALVTGAGRGFGWGIARALGLAGARVCATDVNREELAATAQDLATDGTESATQVLDAGSLPAFQDAVAATVARWGRLDAIVHAGILMPILPFEETSDELWWRQLRVNLGGFYNATRAAWDVMKRQGGGHVIGVASGSSVRGYRNEVAYCTGKHAVEGFVKSLALEAAPYAIAVNTVGPGRTIKPTRITRAELETIPAAERATWTDPVALGQAFVWLAAQPPARFSGFRFDAGPLADTVAAEGFDFAFAPEKVTLYAEDFVARQAWYANYSD